MVPEITGFCWGDEPSGVDLGSFLTSWGKFKINGVKSFEKLQEKEM